jgi:hypothetical protein
MDKRDNKRIKVDFSAEISSSGNVHKGRITDVSREGLGSLLTTHVEGSENFIPEQIVKVNFQLPTGEDLAFECEIRWFDWSTPQKKNLVLGLKIIKPSAAYIEYIQNNVMDRET